MYDLFNDISNALIAYKFNAACIIIRFLHMLLYQVNIKEFIKVPSDQNNILKK